MAGLEEALSLEDEILFGEIDVETGWTKIDEILEVRMADKLGWTMTVVKCIKVFGILLQYICICEETVMENRCLPCGDWKNRGTSRPLRGSSYRLQQ